MGLDKRGKSREYLEGYGDGVSAAWDEVLRMAGKGYTPQEFQIMIKSSRYAMLKDVDPGAQPPGATRAPEKREDASQLVAGTSYLVRELRPDGGFALFKHALTLGKKGFCIARTAPDIVKSRYKLPETKMVWMVSTGGSESSPLPPSALGLGGDGFASSEGTVAPDKLPWIFAMAKEFMDSNAGAGAVILEGLEYLIANNGFKSVLSFVQNLNEAAVGTKCVLIIPVSPETLEPRELAQLERDMGEAVDGSQ
jgi:hypothetical protein